MESHLKVKVSFLEEANYVSELASKVYFIPMFKGEYDLNENIESINDRPVEIVGDNHVNKVILKNIELETDEVFILRDNISPDHQVMLPESHISI